MGEISRSHVKFCLLATKLVSWRGINSCIETGTYRGISTKKLASIFQLVHTIELSEKWHEFSQEKLSECSNIKFHKGDSSTVLRRILPKSDQPLFFFLDAHFAGGDTAFGEKEVPLLDELAVICERRNRDILVIDDVRLIGKTGKSGNENNPIYPLMTFDWRDVTHEKIDGILNRDSRSFTWQWNDQLIVFRNQSTFACLIIRKLTNFYESSPRLRLWFERRFSR